MLCPRVHTSADARRFYLRLDRCAGTQQRHLNWEAQQRYTMLDAFGGPAKTQASENHSHYYVCTSSGTHAGPWTSTVLEADEQALPEKQATRKAKRNSTVFRIYSIALMAMQKLMRAKHALWGGGSPDNGSKKAYLPMQRTGIDHNTYGLL